MKNNDKAAKLELTEHVEDDDLIGKIADEVTVSITPQTDDPNTLAITFRSIFLGCIWAIFLASMNTLFSFRTNPFSVPTGVVQLLAYPMGIFMAKLLPTSIKWLNPGPFTIKEHVIIYLLAGSGGGTAYGIDNVVIQKAETMMNMPNINFWNSLAWVTTSQLVGYGIAGLCRRFLIKPKTMLWPNVLPYIALFVTLNKTDGIVEPNSKYRMSRYVESLMFRAGLISL